MKTALLAFFIFCPLASGQVAEGTFIGRVPTNIRLLPKDFFKLRPTETNLSKLLKQSHEYHAPLWYLQSQAKDRTASSNTILIPLSPELAKLQETVIRNNFHPVDGNLLHLLTHSVSEGLANWGAYNATQVYNRQAQTPYEGRLMIGNNHYQDRLRNSEMLKAIYGPPLNSVLRSLKVQAKHTLLQKLRRKR